jgi:hypothetical protein
MLDNERVVVLEGPEAAELSGGRLACEDLAEGIEGRWISRAPRASGPFSEFAEALMEARVSSAVYILRAMVFRARRISSVCQVDEPL